MGGIWWIIERRMRLQKQAITDEGAGSISVEKNDEEQ
jgi:hypothetical protein